MLLKKQACRFWRLGTVEVLGLSGDSCKMLIELLVFLVLVLRFVSLQGWTVQQIATSPVHASVLGWARSTIQANPFSKRFGVFGMINSNLRVHVPK